MKQISLPSNWMSAYEPIEYVFKDEVSLSVDVAANYVGLVASTLQPLYYKLACFGIGPLICSIGDKIGLSYNAVSVGEPYPLGEHIVTGFDTDNNPILATLVGSVTFPPGTVGYEPFAFLYRRAARTFNLYAGFPSWHPKFSVRSIETLLASITIQADLDFNYVVRVDPFLQSILSNPIPIIGDDDKMYTGFKLHSTGNFSIQEGNVYYCLNGTTEDLNSSLFVTSNNQLTDSQAVKFNSNGILVSKIIDDQVINQVL